MMDNMTIYQLVRQVPDEAKKPIQAGRLKGMTDINPLWRIKKLTETFGPCGIGWWYEITGKQIVEDALTSQKAAFVDILLYYKTADGEVSHGIPGTGGASFVSQERSGPYLSDECYKQALTDAISVAAKALGVGADVYYAADRSKYTAPPEQEKPATRKPAAKPDADDAPPAPPLPPMAADGTVTCPICGKPVQPGKKKSGEIVEPLDVLRALGGMCKNCYRAYNR